jgi:adenylate cyclase
MMPPEHGGCMSATTDAKTERRLLKRPRSSFEGRWDYTAIGTVTNLAARLCGEARSDQILISQSLAAAMDQLASLEALGPLTLKGLARPVPAFSVLALKS